MCTVMPEHRASTSICGALPSACISQSLMMESAWLGQGREENPTTSGPESACKEYWREPNT